jgi:hypothetical protein
MNGRCWAWVSLFGVGGGGLRKLSRPRRIEKKGKKRSIGLPENVSKNNHKITGDGLRNSTNQLTVDNY